ncbi:50S ribosomal protein P1 [Candidatus Woesearchaeota archaeon]|nr:50S ribosomal protein P1 [Candidatus Woesearchaeota archaeon]
MEYIYAAMLIHKAGKKVDEHNVKKVLESAGVAPDDTRVRALVAALDGVNIDEAIQKAAVAQVAVAATPSHEEKKEEKKAEKKEEKKDEEDAAAGLGALFG